MMRGQFGIREEAAMKCEIKGNKLCIEIEIDTLAASPTGVTKTMVVDSSFRVLPYTNFKLLRLDVQEDGYGINAPVEP
jgi:hypothetical protein